MQLEASFYSEIHSPWACPELRRGGESSPNEERGRRGCNRSHLARCQRISFVTYLSIPTDTRRMWVMSSQPGRRTAGTGTTGLSFLRDSKVESWIF
jgi:hypothetical protein